MPAMRQLFSNQPPLTLLSQSTTTGTLTSVVASKVQDGPKKASLDAAMRQLFSNKPPLTFLSQSTTTGTLTSVVKSGVRDDPKRDSIDATILPGASGNQPVLSEVSPTCATTTRMSTGNGRLLAPSKDEDPQHMPPSDVEDKAIAVRGQIPPAVDGDKSLGAGAMTSVPSPTDAGVPTIKVAWHATHDLSNSPAEKSDVNTRGRGQGDGACQIQGLFVGRQADIYPHLGIP